MQEGETFWLFQNLKQYTHTHWTYGDGGYPDWYNKFEENQPDFETEYGSPHSTNGTDQNRGQFPYLLYQQI